MSVRRTGLLRRSLHVGFLLRRALTLGVRGVVEDADKRVLLVRHTYVRGWHFPGGGVEVNETAVEAIIREVREEAAVQLTEPPVLAGAYFNRRLNGRDHVLLFRCPGWKPEGVFRPGTEIADARFFDLAELPADLSLGTRRRIAELYGNAEISAEW